MSRIPTIPSRCSPSTTGRCRIFRSPMEPGSVEHGHPYIDRERLTRHHIADLDGIEIGALAGEAEHVTLGEDADKPASVADRYRADAFLEHAQHRKPYGLAGTHRDHPRPHDVTDRHALC